MKPKNMRLDHETIKSKALGVPKKADLSLRTIEKIFGGILRSLPQH